MINSLARFRAFERVESRVVVSWTGDRYRAPIFESVTEVYLLGAGGRLVGRAFDSYSEARQVALDHVSDTADGCAWLVLYRFNSHPKCFWFEPVQSTVYLSTGESAAASVELFYRWLHCREVPTVAQAARSLDPLAADGAAVVEAAVPDDFARQVRAIVCASLVADAERIARGELFDPPWLVGGPSEPE